MELHYWTVYVFWFLTMDCMASHNRKTEVADLIDLEHLGFCLLGNNIQTL